MWRMCLSKTVARKATAVALNLTPGRAGSLSHLNSLDNKAAGTQAQVCEGPGLWLLDSGDRFAG